MGNIGEDYPHLITDGAVVDQFQHFTSKFVFDIQVGYPHFC